MKYQFITEDEVKTIREAKKVMKNIAKRFAKFEEKEQKAQFDENVDWKPIAGQFHRFCDEIDSIFDYDGSTISINRDVVMNAVMDKIKSRLAELEDMLMPDGILNKNIYDAVMTIRNETDSKLEDKWWEELDKSLNSYVKCYVEYDRLKQSCKR